MSTIRTTLNEKTPGVGIRWSPPKSEAADSVWEKHRNDFGYVWGMINNVSTQTICLEQGMRFFPVGVQPTPGTDIVGYTHGMIRCIYETVRMGDGTAFEMSIGTDTFKLASCLSCSSFMMANGVDASSSHLGAGESWVPYYTTESHNASYSPGDINAALKHCNDKYAACMHGWMTNGVKAMAAVANAGWVNEAHKPALIKFHEHLDKNSTDKNTVARDLYLDAMTYHKKDVLRLTSTLVYGNDKKSPYDGSFDWKENKPIDKVMQGISLNGWVNPFTDNQVNEWHKLPPSLIKMYQIRVWSPIKENSCAIEYSVRNEKGTEVQKSKLIQGPNETWGLLEVSIGTGKFTAAATNDVTKWKIKFDGDKDYSSIRLDQQVAIGSGDRYSYTIINTNI
jgi:hypothetical protein